MSNEQQAQQNPDTSDTLYARGKLTAKQKKFLKAYADCGVVKYACKLAGIHRSTYYEWRDRDEHFKVCLADAMNDATDTLELAAYQQAVLGMEEPAISAGQVVYDYELILDDKGKPMVDDKGKPLMKRGNIVMIRKYSPQLLITLLKANMPEKYRDKASVDINGSIDITGARDSLLAKMNGFVQQEEVTPPLSSPSSESDSGNEHENENGGKAF